MPKLLFAVHSDSFPLLEAIDKVAKENKWSFTTKPWCNNFTIVKWKEDSKSRRFCFYDDNSYNFNNANYKEKDYDGAYTDERILYSLPFHWDVVEKELKKKNKSDIIVQLNSNYKAIVTKDEVIVGCQDFSFNAIEELYKAVQKQKENK